MVGLIISLIIRYALNFDILKRLFLVGTISFLFLIVPLIVFFLVPQMDNVSINNVSHIPVFIEGWLVDFLKGLLVTINYIISFWTSGVLTKISKFLFWATLIVTIIAALYKSILHRMLLLSFFICWFLYFISVVCGYYGYFGATGRSQEIYNVEMRHAVFFAPLIIVTIVIGGFMFINLIGSEQINNLFQKMELDGHINCLRRFRKIYFVGYCVFVLIYSFTGSREIYHREPIDDVRESVYLWEANDGYERDTLVHPVNNLNFHFYLYHSDINFTGKIWVLDHSIRKSNMIEVDSMLEQTGFMEKNEFYYIAAVNDSYIDCSKDYELFKKVVQKHGYQIKELRKGYSALLYVYKW